MKFQTEWRGCQTGVIGSAQHRLATPFEYENGLLIPHKVSKFVTSFSFFGATAQLVPRPLTVEVYRSNTARHTHTQPVGLLWTSDQLVAGPLATQRKTNTTDKHPRPQRDSNPRSQQSSGWRNHGHPESACTNLSLSKRLWAIQFRLLSRRFLGKCIISVRSIGLRSSEYEAKNYTASGSLEFLWPLKKPVTTHSWRWRGGAFFTWERIKGQDVMWHMKKPWYPVRLVIRQCRNPEGQASLSRHVQPKGNPHTALTKQKQNILWPLTMSLSVQWPRFIYPTHRSETQVIKLECLTPAYGLPRTFIWVIYNISHITFRNALDAHWQEISRVHSNKLASVWGSYSSQKTCFAKFSLI
jgi:hypothetical protein